MATLAGAVATAGLLAFAGPASASTSFMSCGVGAFTGTANISPGISASNSNTTPSTITSMGTATGCTGKVTGGSDNATLTTLDPTTGKPGPANCSGFVSPPPAGTNLAKGTFTATWSNGKTSKGTATIKSTSTLAEVKLVEKVTSGYGFLAGHTTKISGTIMFNPVVGDCVTVDITQVSFNNTTNVNFKQS
jgi:hypothetical protein